MIYVGSKNRISKYIAPIIQSYITSETEGYLEPFVGGANMIDKIKHHNRIGCDIDKYIIATLNALKNGWEPPKEVTLDLYKKVRDNKDEYEDYFVGYIGYQLTFGAKWFGGYKKRCDSKSYGDIYSYKSCMRQAPLLSDILFYNKSFQELPIYKIKNHVIYCDIPYKGTLEYKNNKFPYEEFYDWAIELGKNNVVLISEYYMPEDKFECIWEKETKVSIYTNKTKSDNNNNRTEKLFIIKK